MRKLLITVLWALPLGLLAQQFEIGISTGASIYSGDLSPSLKLNMLSDGGGAYGFFGQLNLSESLSLKFNTLHTQLYADDQFGDVNSERNLNFKSKVTELALMGEVRPIQLFSQKSPRLYPYLTVGIGALHFDPLGRINDTYVHLRLLGTEGQGIPGNEDPYGQWAVAVPMGIGIKVTLNQRTTLGAELSYRFLFTDYLDDVSSVEVDYLELVENNGLLAARLSHPGLNPLEPIPVNYTRGGEHSDRYIIANLTLSFRLGEVSANGGNQWIQHKMRRSKCPGFR